MMFYSPNSRFLLSAALAALFLAGLTRPHGLGLFLVGITGICFRQRFCGLTAKTGYVLLIVVVAGLILSFLVVAQLFGPNYVPITTEDAILQEYLLTGQVLDGVNSTHNTGTENYWIRVITIFERFVTFFSFFPPHWSVKHILFSSLFFLPWYFGFVICWWMFGSNQLDARIRCLILFSTVWILSIAAYAGWFTVTYEHRYRLSIMPVFAVQTILGLYIFVPKLRETIKHRKLRGLSS
jgi:hypothetical protein